MTNASIRYHIHTTVVEVFKAPDGLWYVRFDGSHEALGLDTGEPELKVGDKVHITIMKESDNALPSQPPEQ